METFPSGKLLRNGYKNALINNRIRSEVGNGLINQNLKSTINHYIFDVEYYFTKIEFLAFQSWVDNNISVVKPFNWTNPLSGSVIIVRILNGDISDSKPIDNEANYWVTKFKLETI